MKKLNYTQKIGLTAGSAALLTPAVGQATVVHFDDTNAITVSYTGTRAAEWDVDGGGVNDFFLSTTATRFSYYKSIYLKSNSSSGGRGVVGAEFNLVSIYALSSGFSVGTTLPALYRWIPEEVHRPVLYGSSTVLLRNGSLGSNFFGFRFDISGNLHYGWAELILGGGAVTINQWAYENTAGASINVAQTSSGTSPVPEPSSLALLAMGAAGVARMRRKQALAA